MQHLAVSIASNVDSTDKWRLFCDDGGGLSPLLECIREGANSVAEGRQTEVDADGNVLVDDLMQIPPQEEESFLAACTACRALRDICALSPSISAVITEGILRADAASAMKVPNSNPEAKACLSGGYISNLVTLLRHANEAEVLQTRRQSGRREGKHFRRREMVTRRKSRRNRKRKGSPFFLSLTIVQPESILYYFWTLRIQRASKFSAFVLRGHRGET
jgi:hypothetical protein